MWPFLLVLFLILLVFYYIVIKRSLLPSKGYNAQGRQQQQKLEVPQVDVRFVASEFDVLLGRKDLTERDDYVYKMMGTDNMKFCGMVESPSSIILLKDLDLIKKILIKDFDPHFVDRRLFFGAARENSVLRKMLGNLQGDEWKGVRSSVTPTFSTGKIRRMMNTINNVGIEWVKEFSNQCKNQGDSNGRLKINAYSSVRKYTVDVIAGAIFGMEVSSVKNPDSTFFQMASRLTDISTFQLVKFALSLRFPKVFQFFNIDFLDMEALRYFESLLKNLLSRRMQENSDNGYKRHNDFLQLLVEASKAENTGDTPQQQQKLSPLDKPIKNKREFLTDKVMSGQCLSFFFAGFRTTSHFLTFALYTLAIYPDVQTKLREEVAGIFKEEEGAGEHLDYESLANLVYMDMVICEILRKFPATLRLERTCVVDYHDAETRLKVKKGTIVGIPLHSIHNDTKFYERPNDFYPEHFLPEKKAQRSPYAYMPFGMGNRNCIGMRFALVESKAVLAHIVYNFSIEPTEKTPVPLTGLRANFQICPPPDLELALVPRTHSCS